jgi:hypothetical protein
MSRKLELRRRWSGEVGFYGGQMREMERRRARVQAMPHSLLRSDWI